MINRLLCLFQELGRFAATVVEALVPYAQCASHPEVKAKVSPPRGLQSVNHETPRL